MKYRNHESAPYGLYLAKNPLDLTFVSADGELIDGKAGGAYWRVPTLLAVLLSPMIGGIFVMAFPVVVLAACAYGLAHFVTRPVRAFAAQHANLARVRWEPATAYLNNTEDGDDEKGEASEELAELEAEVRAHRVQEGTSD